MSFARKTKRSGTKSDLQQLSVEGKTAFLAQQQKIRNLEASLRLYQQAMAVVVTREGGALILLDEDLQTLPQGPTQFIFEPITDDEGNQIGLVFKLIELELEDDDLDDTVEIDDEE